jgi:AcrR family transcriptional regulator
MTDADDLSTQERPYRMSKRAEQAAATRRRILDAARAALSDGTYHDATMEELAARAGVTRVTVYRTFGSKQTLLQALTWDELARARLDSVDAAHANPDARLAVRDVLRENCRMFADLGDGLPLSLELARHDEEVAALVDATYHGRRHRSMEKLARRIAQNGLRAPGWTTKQVADALLVLTSFEAFETLTTRRRSSPQAAADTLFALASAFLADEPDTTRRATS